MSEEPDPQYIQNIDYTFFKNTCSRCPNRGDWEMRQFAFSRSNSWSCPTRDFVPLRCPSCNKKKCKEDNAERTMTRLSSYSWERRGQHSKMITIGLVSSWNDTRTKFHQLKELRQRWKRLRDYLIAMGFITGGSYVTEVTQKVTFDGTVTYWDRDQGEYVEHVVGDVDPYGLVKFHAHIHAVVDMHHYRGAALAKFSELGYKFGLGRISVTFAKPGDSGWSTVKNQANYLAKYITKDIDCGRQATFGKFIGFKPPEERIWLETKLDVKEAEALSLRN